MPDDYEQPDSQFPPYEPDYDFDYDRDSDEIDTLYEAQLDALYEDYLNRD